MVKWVRNIFQVENEYGSYYTCDHQYMSHLQATFEQHLGKDVILFTTDGYSDRMLECGTLPTLFTTIDFGAGKGNYLSISFTQNQPVNFGIKILDIREVFYHKF